MRGAMAWRSLAAAAAAVLACTTVGAADLNRVERAADIEVEINGDVTTTKYLTTTRPLPTGVLLSSAPTFVSDGTTSEYTTLVIGTVSGGRYSRIVSTAQRVFYAIPRKDDRPQPTGVVSEAVNTEVNGAATTVHRTRYIRTSIGSSYGQVIEMTSSVMPQLHGSQEELLPTVTVGEPVQYPSKTTPQLLTEEPAESNEIPSARQVVEGEQVIIVEENVVHADRSKKILPTYTASGDDFVLSTPVVIVPNRASFEKTQELLNEKVHKMVKDLNLEETDSSRESRNLSDLETIEILDLDLALSGSELTTVTYVGFSDFVTTIGSTVVVFMPQSAGAAAVRQKMQTAGNFVGPSRSGKVLLTRAPVFVPNRGNVITTTRTFQDKESTKALEEPASVEENIVSVDSVKPVLAEKPESETNVLSTASTRVYNTIDLYPTGLVTSIGGTVAREKVTTVFTTLVYGTFIKGRYAKVVKSTSSIYYLVSKTDSVQPTAVVKGTPSTVLAGNVGRAVGSSPAEQFIVDSVDEAKAALKISQLEASTQPSTVPALFSSQADTDEENSVLKTYYTTFTFFSTLSSGGSTEVKTSLSTLTSVASEKATPPAVTYYTTSTFFITSTVGGVEVVSTSYSTKSEVVKPTQVKEAGSPSLSQKHITKTYFTTYTYFTTTHDGEKSVVQSRLEVSSNIETLTVPLTESKVVPKVQATTSEPSPVEYSTGLLSSRMTSEVNSGVTTVSSTGYFGTFVNGLYAQIIKSTTKTQEKVQSSSSFQPILSAIRSASISASDSKVSGGFSGLPKFSATPTINRPSSGTKPLLKISSAVSSSQINILSSLRSQISSSAAESSRRTLNTNRSFLPFRTSKNRKSGGLLALLAKSGGFASETESESKSVSSSTKLSRASSSVETTSISSTTSIPRTSTSAAQITPTSRVRGLPSRSRRPFLGLRRPGRPGGLRGFFQNSNLRAQEGEEDEITTQTPEELTTTVSTSTELISVPSSTDKPTTEPIAEITTEADVTTTKPLRVLAFGRSRPQSGTRNALPLRRRPNEGPRRGLASRFSSVTAGNSEPEETTEAPTSTTTTTTERATTRSTTEAETDPPTEATTETTTVEPRAQPTDAPRRRQRGRLRGRVARPRNTSPVPFGGRRSRGRRPVSVEEVTEPVVEETTTAVTEATPIIRRVRVRRPGGRRGRLARGRRRRPVSTQDLEAAGSEIYEEYAVAESAPALDKFSEQNHFLDEAGSEVEEVVVSDNLRAALDVAQTGELPSLSRTKRQSSFGARNSARAAQSGASSQERVLTSLDSGDQDSLTERERILANRRRRKNSGRNKARQSRQSEIPRARQVRPSPTESEEKPKFTITSDSSRGGSRFGLPGNRGRTRSTSNTRRAIPGSRRRRPTAAAGDTSEENSQPKLTLRQRLEQAQIAAAGSNPTRPGTSDRNSQQSSPVRSSSSSSNRTPSRPSSSRGTGAGTTRNRGRRPSLGSIRGRDREPPDPLEIVPTPVLDEGQIIVVSDEQVSASIPVISNGKTSYKNVFTARTITKTLEYDQYTETEVNGELRTHLGFQTTARPGGVTEVTTLFIEPTEIKTSVLTPSRVRGNQVKSVASSYLQPAFTVRPEVNTAAGAFQPPQQNNNALTALLQQLLAGNQQPLPRPVSPLGSFGGGNFGLAQSKPQQAYRTVVFTTTYVTTLTKSDATTVPIFFKGRKTNTVIVNKETEVITATEVVTESKPIPGQTVAPAVSLGSGFSPAGLLGLTPQQLLLQQLLNRQVQQPRLPAIQPTLNMAASQPPQLEELLRQATQVSQQPSAPAARALPQPESTSVVTIYVSGSRPGEFFTRLSTVTLDAPIEPSRIKRGDIPTALVKATEIPAYIETDQGLFKIPKDENIFGDLDFYVMSAMNEIEPDMVNLKSTQTLESVKGESTRYIEKVIDVVPSLTKIISPETNSFLWDGPAEYAPLSREKRQLTRGRARSNGNDLSFAQERKIGGKLQAETEEPAFVTFTYANTLTDQFGNVLVSTTEQALRKLTTQGNIEFVDLTKLNAKPTAANNLLVGILQTKLNPLISTSALRGAGLTSNIRAESGLSVGTESESSAPLQGRTSPIDEIDNSLSPRKLSGTDSISSQSEVQVVREGEKTSLERQLFNSNAQERILSAQSDKGEAQADASATQSVIRTRQVRRPILSVLSPAPVAGRRRRIRTRVVTVDNSQPRISNSSVVTENVISDITEPIRRNRIRTRQGLRTSRPRNLAVGSSSKTSEQVKTYTEPEATPLRNERGRTRVRQRTSITFTGNSITNRQGNITPAFSQRSSTQERLGTTSESAGTQRPITSRRRRVRVRTRFPTTTPRQIPIGPLPVSPAGNATSVRRKSGRPPPPALISRSSAVSTAETLKTSSRESSDENADVPSIPLETNTIQSNNLPLSAPVTSDSRYTTERSDVVGRFVTVRTDEGITVNSDESIQARGTEPTPSLKSSGRNEDGIFRESTQVVPSNLRSSEAASQPRRVRVRTRVINRSPGIVKSKKSASAVNGSVAGDSDRREVNTVNSGTGSSFRLGSRRRLVTKSRIVSPVQVATERIDIVPEEYVENENSPITESPEAVTEVSSQKNKNAPGLNSFQQQEGLRPVILSPAEAGAEGKVDASAADNDIRDGVVGNIGSSASGSQGGFPRRRVVIRNRSRGRTSSNPQLTVAVPPSTKDESANTTATPTPRRRVVVRKRLRGLSSGTEVKKTAGDVSVTSPTLVSSQRSSRRPPGISRRPRPRTTSTTTSITSSVSSRGSGSVFPTTIRARAPFSRSRENSQTTTSKINFGTANLSRAESRTTSVPDGRRRGLERRQSLTRKADSNTTSSIQLKEAVATSDVISLAADDVALIKEAEVGIGTTARKVPGPIEAQSGFSNEITGLSGAEDTVPSRGISRVRKVKTVRRLIESPKLNTSNTPTLPSNTRPSRIAESILVNSNTHSENVTSTNALGEANSRRRKVKKIKTLIAPGSSEEELISESAGPTTDEEEIYLLSSVVNDQNDSEETVSTSLQNDVITGTTQAESTSETSVRRTRPITQRQRVRIVRTRLVQQSTATTAPRRSRPTFRQQQTGGQSPIGRRRPNQQRPLQSRGRGRPDRPPVQNAQEPEGTQDTSTETTALGPSEDVTSSNGTSVRDSNGSNEEGTTETNQILRKRVRKIRKKIIVANSTKTENEDFHRNRDDEGSENADELFTSTTERPRRPGTRRRVVNTRRLLPPSTDSTVSEVKTEREISNEDATTEESPVTETTVAKPTTISTTAVSVSSTTPSVSVTETNTTEPEIDTNVESPESVRPSSEDSGTSDNSARRRRPGLRRPSTRLQTTASSSNRRRPSIRRPELQRQNEDQQENESLQGDDETLALVNALGGGTTTTTERTRNRPGFRSRGRRPSSRVRPTRRPRPPRPERPQTSTPLSTTNRTKTQDSAETLVDIQEDSEVGQEPQETTTPSPRRPSRGRVRGTRRPRPSTTKRTATTESPSSTTSRNTLPGARRPSQTSSVSGLRSEIRSRTGTRTRERNRLRGQTSTPVRRPSIFSQQPVEEEAVLSQAITSSTIPSTTTTTQATTTSQLLQTTSETTTAVTEGQTEPPETTTKVASTTRRAPFFPGLRRGTSAGRTRGLFANFNRNTTPRTTRPTLRSTIGILTIPTRRPAAQTTQRSTTTTTTTERQTSPIKIPFLVRPPQTVLNRDTPEISTELVDTSEIVPEDQTYNTKAETTVTTEIRPSDVLPDNVVYKQFNTVSLVEILGGRQTLTLSVLTSTLTTLAPSQLHLTTDAPWLFDGSSPPSASESVKPSYATSASVPSASVTVKPTITFTSLQISKTRFDSISVRIPDVINLDSSRTNSRGSSVSKTTLFATKSAVSIRPLTSTRGKISSSRPLSSRQSSSRDPRRLFTLRASSSINRPQATAASVIKTTSSSLKTTISKIAPSDTIRTAGAIPEDNITYKPETAVRILEDTTRQQQSMAEVSLPASVPPVLQGTLYDPTEDTGQRPPDGLDIIRELLAINAVTATPALEGAAPVSSSSTSLYPSPTIPSLITSSGTVVIFAELITSQAEGRNPGTVSGGPGSVERAEVGDDVSRAPVAVPGIATKVMNNGVPVLVAGGRLPQEQVVSNGQVVLNSGTLTLPALPLSDVMSLSPSVETDPGKFLTRGTEGFDSRFYRTHTYYTTFTFLNHYKENGKSVVVTSRETVSNVLTLPAAVITPSSTQFQTETYLTTYTYYKTTTQGNREQVASTQEVVTQIVVTEAPVTVKASGPTITPTRSLLFTKTYLSTVTLFDTAVVAGEQVIVSSTSVIKELAIETSYLPDVRPTSTRPPIRATAAPAQRPSVLPTPVVDSSLLPVDEQDEIHVVATRTFYTTSTFYTTLLEGSSTVVRTRTEITSRVQTEKVTTRLDPSHLSSFRGSLSASGPSTAPNPSTTQTRSTAELTLYPAAVSTGSSLVTAPVEAQDVAEPADYQAASILSENALSTVDAELILSDIDGVGDVDSEAAYPSEELVDDEKLVVAMTADSELTSSASVTTIPSAAGEEMEEASLVTAGSVLTPTTLRPDDPVSGASSPDGVTSSTPSPGTSASTESTAASLGNLAGSLLGLSGLAAGGLNLGSMVDTAAGLIRNVLPLAVRREDNQQGRPPPAVHVQQRNPAFIPIGGVAASLRRNQQTLSTAPAPGGGFLVVRGPGGQLIPVRGVPDGPPPPQRPGAPIRRVERPRRPGPGPQRQDGPPRAGQKLPSLRPGGGRRPGRPSRPNRRNQQAHHLAKPNGFIAVFPGQGEPPHQQDLYENQEYDFEGGFQGQDVSFPVETQGGFTEVDLDQDYHPGAPFQVHVHPGPVHNSQQRVDSGPGSQPRPRPGLVPPEQQELTPMFEGPDFENPSMEFFGATDGRRPFPSGGFLQEFGPGTSTRVRVSITTGVQTQFISPSSAGPHGETKTSQPVPQPVVVVGASVPSGFDDQDYEESSQFHQVVVESETAPSYVDGEFADQTGEDDQDYAASVQGPYGATQLTYFNNEGTEFEPVANEQNIRQPIDQYIPEQAIPVEQPAIVHVRPTLQTVAQLEGNNRIVGTNVFANVVPITTKPAVITISFPREEEQQHRPASPVPVPVRTRHTNPPQLTRRPDQSSTLHLPTYVIEGQTNHPATILPEVEIDFVPEFTTEVNLDEEEFTSQSPSFPEVDLDLAASVEKTSGRPRQEQTSSSIIGDEENEKINFILSSSFEEATTSKASSTTSTTSTPSLTSSRKPTRLADRIRQTLLASLSSVAAGAATSRIQTGASTAILGPDVRTLVSDTRLTSRPGGSETVIEGESTVFGGLFTRPHLPVHNVHDITEIVHGPGQQEITKYITRTEQFTRTVTATKTDIRFEGSSVVTSTKIITSTLPPITIVSTVVGTSTQVHTLNTATPTRVRPLSTTSKNTTPLKSRPPPRPRLPPPPPPRRPDDVNIAGVIAPDPIDISDIRSGVSDENEVNRVIISPGVGQGLVVEQSEAVATLCDRPCLPDIFETCRRVDQQYRCACRPGYSRAREEDPCEPTLTYRLHVLLDRVNDIPLSFRAPFGDAGSSEFRQMSHLTETGLVEALASTPLSERLHTARLMRFQPGQSQDGLIRRRQDGLMAELMLQVSDRRSQSMDRARLEETLQQALTSANYSLGGRQVVVSRQRDAVTALDFDECEDVDYNDCHAQAFCYNLVGTFTCSCRDGMVDADVTGMPGRTCLAESVGCEECSYSGECYTRDNGATGCRCHRWYAGNRCQINLRVLLIALVTVGVVLALMLCACCFLCCRRRGRAHTAPPLVFTGPAGFLRHRGTSLNNAVLDRRAMLDSSSDTSAPSPPRRMTVAGGKRSAPVPPVGQHGRSRRAGPASGSFQEDRSMASTGIRPPVFIPRAKHKHPTRPNSSASSAVCVGADASADLRTSQSRLLSVLEPGGRPRGRTGTLASQRTSRSVSSGRRGRTEVSQQPAGGRSRSSDNLSQRTGSLADPGDYGSHAFFRERTMSEARSFDETTIRPTVRSVRGSGTQRSRLSSAALSYNQNTYDHHTMAERDAASTFVMPETQLFRPPQDGDTRSDLSLAEEFPRIHASGRASRTHSTAGSRRNHR